MSIANHTLIGGMIAVVVKQPALVLPLAYLSHFVLDALPHFGYYQMGYTEAFKHWLTFIEQCFSIPAAIWVLFLLKHHGVLPYLAALIALSPDLLWPYRYFWFERKGLAPPRAGPITRFHQRIQWCERPWGFPVEIIWFGLFVSLLQKFV